MTDSVPPAGSETPDFDDLMFELLSSPSRRTVLRHLANCPLPVTVEELVAVLVAAETERARTRIGDERRSAIGIALRHVHLPKLAEAGLVDGGGRGPVALSPLGRSLASARPRVWNSFDITFRDGVETAGQGKTP